MAVALIQILYDEKQREELYPFAIPYFNEKLSPYFENSVIADIVPSISSDYISVCSWRLRRKRGDVHHWLKNDSTLTEYKLESFSGDVAILTPRSPAHKTLLMAATWHGEYWVDAFDHFKPFLNSLGLTVPKCNYVPGDPDLNHAIYENHFVARMEIYHDYVLNCLRPAIQFMEQNKEVYMAPSGYKEKKRNANEEIKLVQGKLGMTDWPIAPFILERLFSIYINDKGLMVSNL